jgi:hypothetical protein
MSGTDKISIKYLNDIRRYLRNPAASLNGEIRDLINAARDDLILGGVLPQRATDEKDALVKRAVGIYVKAEFGLDNDDSEKYMAAYDKLRDKLTLSDTYLKGAT